MTAYVIKRLLLFIPTVVIVTFVAFFIVNILPGDAAFLSMVGEGEGAEKIDPEVLENVRRELGIDRPILVQYVDWFGGVLTGDFGTSFKTKTPVIDALERRFPLTIQLAVMSVIISMVLAVPLGVWSAVKQDSGVDYGTKIFTILFVAAPTFWTALLLQTGLVIWAGWLPPLKYVALWDGPLANLEILIFPAMVLGLHDMAFIARLTRSSMLEVLREDYVRTARAKGLRDWVVIGRHSLKNAFLPILTVSGWRFSNLIGGIVIIETVFNLPGIGNLLITSLNSRDLPSIQALILVPALAVMAINLVIDLWYGWLDPRVRYA